MNLFRYYPDDEQFGQLHRDINRLFENAQSSDSSSATADWAPPVDIDEYPDRFTLLMDVPGVRVADVELSLERGVLSISGTRSLNHADEQPERQRLERPRGRFHRRFTLPDTVDAEKVKASARDGVLEIVIPKHAKVQPRKIAIES